MSCQLYRHFDSKGALLYVGISINAVNRLSQHKDYSDWFKKIETITIEQFDSRELALDAEKNAIINENPKYNIRRPKTPFQDESKKIPGAGKSIGVVINKIVNYDAMYTIQEAAEELRIGPTTIKRLIDEGELGCVTIGRYKRITGWQLIDYIEHIQLKATK